MPLRLLLLTLLPLAARGEVIRVTPGTPGAVQAAPGAVQAALDRARAGDTVRLAPGVYRERVVFTHGGEHGRPVVLEGEPGAILDGSDPFQPVWQPAPDIAPGVWRASVPFNPFDLIADGKIVTMLREDRVDPARVADPAWHWPRIFRDGVGPSGWEGVKALGLYFSAKQELIVRFQGDLDPRAMAILLAPRQPIVEIVGTDRCVVRGLTLRNGAFGVRIGDSLGSVVEGCTLGPVDYGVWLDPGSDRCTVRFCDIFMNPYAGVGPDRPGAWDNWQAHKTGGSHDRYGVQILHTVGGHEVHDNFIHDTWDGIEDVGAEGENRGLRIHHNRIARLDDDALEPNGAEEDCDWSHNWVEDSRCGFRIKAPRLGPLYAHHNLFFSSHEDYRNYGEVELKPARVYVYHNTSTARVAVMSNKVRGIGTPRYHYFNNLFWCAYPWAGTADAVKPNWRGDYNVYVRRDADRRWDTSLALLHAAGIDLHSLFTPGEPGFADFPKHDVTLRADSPARGRGADLERLLGVDLPGVEPLAEGAKPDAGALAFGQPLPVLPRRPEDVTAPPAGTWPDASARREDPWAGENLLTNGSFEQGAEGWTGLTAPLWQVVDAPAADGTRVLRGTFADQRSDINRPLTGLTPGQAYVLVYRSRRSTVDDFRVIVRDLGNGAYLAQGPAAPGEVWRRTVLRFVATEAMRLELSPRTLGTVEVDGVGVYEGRQG